MADLPADINGSLGSDPSHRTMERILREIGWTKEVVDARSNIVTTRLDAMDKAIVLLQAFADKAPTTSNVAEQVRSLGEIFEMAITKEKEITNEKFNSVDKQFLQRDTAVASALQAQEKQAIATNDSNNKANAKTEDNFTKLIEQGRELQQSMKANTDIQIADIKSRLDKGEGGIAGSDRLVTEKRLDAGLMVGIIGSIMGFVAIGITVVALILRH